MDQQHAFKNPDRVIIQLWSASIVVLVALTWKLWLPGFTNFPRVPVFANLTDLVLMVMQYAATFVLAVSLIAVAVGVRQMRFCCGAIAISFGILFVCNQHCLQPWAWQAFIIATLLAGLPLREAKIWIARILISIYLYSAIGKFDFQFVHSTGQEFLNVVLGWLGQTDAVSEVMKVRLALLFPIGEMLIAIGLMVPRTRKAAAMLAIGLHLMLIAVLSPLGLGHRWPVVIWNAVSILLIVWVFLVRGGEKQIPKNGLSTSEWLFAAFAVVILVGPLLRPMQLWDHWLAWGLYSPSNSRIELLVSDAATDRMDNAIQPYFIKSDRSYGSSEFAIDRWSLDELGVPIYPQARFQKAAAIRWVEQNELARQATMFEYGPSHPMTGARSKTTVRLQGDRTIPE